MRIGWVGFHVEGIPALHALLARGIPVEAALTLQSDQAAKRSGVAEYPELCGAFGVPLYKIKNINDDDALRILRDLKLDVIFVIGWSQIVRGEALRTARLGMIGAHASLLPHNRGRAPINWALIKGATETGNSLIWLAENVDEGDIIAQTKFAITPYDTCATLYEKVAASNREMILNLLPQLDMGERPGLPQAHGDEPLLPGRKPEDGLINWNGSGAEIYNFVRALARPYPGAFSWLNGRRWIVRESALLPGIHCPEARSGQVTGAMLSPVREACGQIVACGADAPWESEQNGLDGNGNGRAGIRESRKVMDEKSRSAIALLELEGEDGSILKGRELSEKKWEGQIWRNE